MLRGLWARKDGLLAAFLSFIRRKVGMVPAGVNAATRESFE
jgi:hypothetical protein